MDELKAAAPIEAPSSEVRKNWADYLERVRTDEETVYITQHGKRVAALVPPFVAESYADEQAWFHTPQWQAKEAEADADLAAGRVKVYDSDESFLAEIEGCACPCVDAEVKAYGGDRAKERGGGCGSESWQRAREPRRARCATTSREA